MGCLIEVNRSSPPIAWLYGEAGRLRHWDSVCLVHVIPSGRAAEVAAGQRLLKAAARTLHCLDRHLVIEARMEIGEVADHVLRVAQETLAELIVTAAHGEGDFPYLEPLGRAARLLLTNGRLPVLLVSPTGAVLRDPDRPDDGLSGRYRSLVTAPDPDTATLPP